jgi:sugar (pentulose or hexulose) kinase
MKNRLYLSIDNGASGGRAILGRMTENKLSIEEIHRYQNQMISVFDHCYWDILTLFQKIKDSLKKCAAKITRELDGIGLDNWGVDFCLLGKEGSLLGYPFAYRDKKNEEVFEEVFNYITRKRLYEITGIQILHYNPLFQLFALAKLKHPTLELADTFLFIADLFNYYLSGIKKAEFSLASGSQLYDNNAYCWSKEIFDALGLPFNITPDLVEPATVLGELLENIKKETGIKSAKVIAPLTHDTGSAVAAIPLKSTDWAFLSSGTWSALGTVEKKPVINELSFRYNFTNEGGLHRSARFLKNITGLWLLQRCKSDWEKEGASYSYTQLIEMAREAKPFQSIINPDDPSFFNPPDMAKEIISYCKRSNQYPPENRGEIVRTILESLALIYRNRLEIVERCKGSIVRGLHIVGGGTRNTLLNQFVVNCIQRPVMAGPAEATAIGNIIVQAMADGFLSDINEGHTLIRKSFNIMTYEPDVSQKAQWDDTYEQFIRLIDN